MTLRTIDKKVKYKGYKHIQSFVPDDILELVEPQANAIKVNVDGMNYKARVSSLRLQCFKRSRRCVNCGLEGTIMSLDSFTTKSDRGGFHFNLYAKFEGKTRLMTKDHIVPKSKGGADHLDNLQTMCDECNRKKGSKIPEEYITENVAPFGSTLNIEIGV